MTTFGFLFVATGALASGPFTPPCDEARAEMKRTLTAFERCLERTPAAKKTYETCISGEKNETR